MEKDKEIVRLEREIELFQEANDKYDKWLKQAITKLKEHGIDFVYKDD